MIAILGTSYCGSTILEMLLDSQPGMVGAGEVRWFADAPNDQPSRQVCTIHHAACPVFTDKLRAECRAYPRELYQRVQRALDAPVLLTSDKHSEVYQIHGFPDKAIVCFKHPAASVLSFMKHEKIEPSEHLKWWHIIYSKNLAFLEAHEIPYICVQSENLVNTDFEIERIMNFLDMPFDRSALKHWWNKEGSHRIGGNSGVHKNINWDDTRWIVGNSNVSWYKENYRQIVCDERWKSDLSERDLRDVAENVEAMNLFRYLERRAKDD